MGPYLEPEESNPMFTHCFLEIYQILSNRKLVSQYLKGPNPEEWAKSRPVISTDISKEITQKSAYCTNNANVLSSERHSVFIIVKFAETLWVTSFEVTLVDVFLEIWD
jgi:hypothetical protein